MSKKYYFLLMALIIGASFFVGDQLLLADDSSITVLSPNGGEQFSSRTIPYSIKINTNKTGSISIYLVDRTSSDWSTGSGYGPIYTYFIGGYGPNTYTLDQNNTFNGTIYLNALTHFVPGKYYLLARWFDPNNPMITYIDDFSDAPFTIVAPTTNQPSITVLSPNGGERLIKDSNYLISWSASKNMDFKSDIKLSSDAQDFPIALGVSGNSYSWIVGKIIEKILLPLGDYKVKICVAGTSDCDSSDASFAITSSSAQPSVTILSPNGGETYKNDGSPITVNWQTNNVPASRAINIIRLRAYPNGREYNLATNVLNDGQEVVVPSSLPVGAYTLEIKTYVGETLVMDSSDSYFRIVDSITPIVYEQVKCVFNGSNSQEKCYAAAETNASDWFTCSGVGTCVADVKGLKGTQLTWKSSCAGDKLPVTIIDGNNEYVNFSCSGTTQPSITVLSPNGGENLQSGSSYSVRWTSNNLPSNASVNVWLLDNPTRLGSMVLAGVPNTGSANWIVSSLNILTDQKTFQPVVPSGNYVIFIECADHNCTVDDSDSPFTITASSLTVEEQVKCVFKGATSEQKCYTATDNTSPYSSYSCGGTESCVVDLKGTSGDKITWKSSCGGYAYSVLDGSNDYAIFDCASSNTTTTPTVSQTPTQQVSDINEKSKLLSNNNFDFILAELNQLRNTVEQQKNQIKYLSSLLEDVKGLSADSQNAINNFITYGVDANTKKLGAGERAAVMNSYKAAYNILPQTQDQFADAIKIANGRFPSVKSDKAEKNATEQFVEIYKKTPDLNNPNDNAAINIIAYGLKQTAGNRNLESETKAMKIYKNIFGAVPTTTTGWNNLQAIAYSGASREKDSDGDLLPDKLELQYGTNPNKSDTDGDGHKDGEEVIKGYNPNGAGNLILAD